MSTSDTPIFATTLTPQVRLLRLFNRIRLLNRRSGFTIFPLTDYLDISERTVHRYINLLQTVGYSTDPDRKRYFLFKNSQGNATTFTEEETEVLRQPLGALLLSKPLTISTLQELLLGSTLRYLAEGLINLDQRSIISILADTVRDKVQVRLIRYHSTHSATISDRLHEPVGITHHVTLFRAFDAKADVEKAVKIDGIEQVKITHGTVTHTVGLHQNALSNWSDYAYRLLIEGFPGSRTEIFIRSGACKYRYRWCGHVRDYVELDHLCWAYRQKSTSRNLKIFGSLYVVGFLNLSSASRWQHATPNLSLQSF